jgi:amino acid transporter
LPKAAPPPNPHSVSARGVREIGPDTYAITSDRPPSREPARSWHKLRRLLLGRPLPSTRERRERLGWITALAILGADSIASTVYGPEEMLRTLAPGGPAATATFALPIAIAIVGLLTILAISYWQTIAAYPSGAGAYIIAGQNLGRVAGLAAAAALLIDYTLDVAVSVASGIQSATSALPILAPFREVLALGALAAITVANLRGIRAAGAVLSVPIYVYIVGSLVVIGLGIFHWATGTLPPYTPPAGAAALAPANAAVGVFLLVRAFSSGAVALTGIEAISNGVPYLRPPEARNAHRTLACLAVTFGVLFLGISFVAGQLGVIPDPAEVETVHSQLTRTILGSGAMHVVLEAAALLLLVLAADTGFADFPRLVAMLAQDGYLPEAFAVRGARLAYSNGIVLVAGIAALLIVIFRGSVAALVPLFTVGAFLTFTLSQIGMASHWWRRRSPGWRWRCALNGFGALVTTVVLGIVVISKFVYGAWMVVLVLPLLVLALHAIGDHHQRLVRRVRVASTNSARHALAWTMDDYVVIPVHRIDRITLHAIAYVQALTSRSDAVVRIEAVHVTDDVSAGQRLRAQWDAIESDVPMVLLDSPYRATASALVRYLDAIQKRDERHTFVTIVLPEVLPTRWWHPFLENYLAWRLKWILLFRPRTAVVSVPYAVGE